MVPKEKLDIIFEPFKYHEVSIKDMEFSDSVVTEIDNIARQLAGKSVDDGISDSDGNDDSILESHRIRGLAKVTEPKNVMFALNELKKDFPISGCFYVESKKTFYVRLSEENKYYQENWIATIDIVSNSLQRFFTPIKFSMQFNQEKGFAQDLPEEFHNAYKEWIERGKEGCILHTIYPKELDITSTKQALKL